MKLSPKHSPVTTMKVPTGERKEIDSPLTTQTTQTDASTSLEEDTLMTPPPMPSRLGRIIFSSQSSSTDGSYSTTDGENESKASTHHHRRLNMPHATTRSKLGEESKTDEAQQDALVHALQQLQKLATLDSNEYQQRLLENTLPSLQQIEKPQTSLFCPSLADTSSSKQELSELSQSIQTPLVQLSMSIHRLHAVVANITKELDGHTDEVQELQFQLSTLRQRNQKLEKAAKKVHTKNLQLEKQAKLDRRIVGGLQHKVRQYEAQLESQGFQLMASKVQNHEIQLQLSKNRVRVDSNMSEFLDIGAEDDSHLDDCQGSIQTSTTSSTMNEAPSPNRPNLASKSFDTATDSSCGPVIRFSKDGAAVTPDRGTKKAAKNPEAKDCESERSTQQRGEKPKETIDAKSNEKSLTDRFARFLGPHAIQNYNLKIVPPCNIQFVEIPLKSANKKDESTALAVCGLQGFNDELNMKPTIGAQITKINGNSIDERCTLQELYSKLDKHTTKKPVILTFRNERWDSQQTKILNAAIHDQEKSRGKSKEKSNGASLFVDSQTANDGELVERGETDFAPRARTGSSDSVGKVMDGIGNFLQNLKHPEGEPAITGEGSTNKGQ